jgi:hypothetical protein
MQGRPVETAETERRQQDRPAACVVAQQYSSATCVSVLFHYRTEKFGTPFKNLISVCLILLKFGKSETGAVSVTAWTAERDCGSLCYSLDC